METYKNIPPQERNGYIYFLTDIQVNKPYDCLKGCYSYYHCCIEPNPPCSFCCTEVSIHIVATSSVDDEKFTWQMDDRNFLLIGTNGYVYKGVVACDRLKGIQRHLKDRDEVLKSTQADIVLHFPQMPDGVTVRDVIIKGRPRLTITVMDDNEDDYNLDNYKDKVILSQPLLRTRREIEEFASARKNEGRGLISDLNLFKTLIFQRFNTHLTTGEIEQIEKQIEIQDETVAQYFKDTNKGNSSELQELYKEYREEANYYREMWSEKKKAERERLISISSVTDILNISPDEFERLCAEVLIKIGCYDVMVTPHSNDNGIDVFGKMNGKTIVAQCKRFLSNPVGSPDMQRFIGAMQNADADKGIFFTTASFTEGAVTMAKKNGITMFDRTAFTNFFSLISSVEIEKDVAQPTLWDNEDLPE